MGRFPRSLRHQHSTRERGLRNRLRKGECTETWKDEFYFYTSLSPEDINHSDPDPVISSGTFDLRATNSVVADSSTLGVGFPRKREVDVGEDVEE